MVLQESKKKYQEKIHRLKEKTKKIKKEEKELVDNLAKFNTFVKEKKLKVERALKTEMEEKTMRKNMTVEIGKIWALKIYDQFIQLAHCFILGFFFTEIVEFRLIKNIQQLIRSIILLINKIKLLFLILLYYQKNFVKS